MIVNDSLPPYLIEKIQNGETLLFLGAGASKGAKGPKGELALSANQLRDKIADNFLGGQQKDKSLVQVADYAKHEAGLSTVQSHISHLLEPLQPALFHRLIPTFRWRAIITTNYDLIVERAYDTNPERLQVLAKIIRNGDNFSEKIRDPNAVPFLKLHGCVNTINDENLPLILGSEEYAKYRKNRDRLFDHFQEWGREHPIIFCGYEVADPNLQQILFDLSDMGINRPEYVIVSPTLNDFDHRLWQGRRFTTLKITLEQFLSKIDTLIPKHNRALSSLRREREASIEHIISSNVGLSDQLIRYLDSELEHVHTGLATQGVTPQNYYRGVNDSWSPYQQEFDVRRRITDDIITDVMLDDSNGLVRVFLLKGHAGSGKSAVLRRVAWESVTDYDSVVLWLKEGGIIRPNLIRELYNLLDRRFTIFIEDFNQEQDDINKLIDIAKKHQFHINIIIGARTNEWNVYGDELEPHIDKEYELRDLSEKEIKALLEKLEQHNCLGELLNKPYNERVQYFRLTADRQILVALHEATYGNPFEKILYDEYSNITPKEAQILYLDICTLNRMGVGVRAGLISRVSGINFEYFSNRLFKPLEHVIRTVHDWKVKDILFKTRHPLIANLVFNQVFLNQKERADQIIRMLRHMNVDYETDHKAFCELIRGRTVAELFSQRAFADQLYKAANETTASKGFIEHQRAIFELQHPGGNINGALQAITNAEEYSDGNDKSINHTKATIFRELSLSANTIIEKGRYRNEAKAILLRQVKKTKTPHPIHTLSQIYIDEIGEMVQKLTEKPEDQIDDLERRAVFELIRKTESILQQGLQRFPDDEFLMTSDSRLARIINDELRAFQILEEAFESNPRSGYIAVRLSRYFKKNNQKDKVIPILQKCIDQDPLCKEVHLEIALNQIEENEELHSTEIIRHLRSSFTDGDTNFEAQFWFARHNFIYGDRRKARDIFTKLKKTPLPPEMRSKLRGKICDSQKNSKTFHGIVKTVYDTYCFVTCSELDENIFIYRTSFNDDIWDQVSAQMSAVFEVSFTLRGPAGINANITTVL
jgi:hypothetical protein